MIGIILSSEGTVVTASHLSVETFVSRQPHCDGLWFQPTDEVLHYVGHILLQCGGECSSKCLFGLDYSVSLR